jgi:hypothetical protein
VPAAAKPRINEADEAQIQQEVLGYLLTRHFWDDNVCSAIFVQADEFLIATRIPPNLTSHNTGRC